MQGSFLEESRSRQSLGFSVTRVPAEEGFRFEALLVRKGLHFLKWTNHGTMDLIGNQCHRARQPLVLWSKSSSVTPETSYVLVKEMRVSAVASSVDGRNNDLEVGKRGFAKCLYFGANISIYTGTYHPGKSWKIFFTVFFLIFPSFIHASWGTDVRTKFSNKFMDVSRVFHAFSITPWSFGRCSTDRSRLGFLHT